MKTKTFTFSDGEEYEARELTVGQMRKVTILLEADELDASMYMVSSSLGIEEAELNDLYMSDIKQVSDWLAEPDAD